jgi:predicted DNA-binding protein
MPLQIMLTRCVNACYTVFMDKTMTFRIPAALLAKLEKLAKADERSVGFLIRKAVEEYVEQHKGGK